MDLRNKPFYLSEEQEKQVLETVSSMTDREKIGQLFCLLGDAYTPEQLEVLAKQGIGGVLFRPVRNMEEIARDFEKLDKLSKYPLLHAANLEEGGAGAAADGTYFASQLQVAASEDREDCIHFARVCADEGLKAGINWTFSPVSDIDINFRNPITNCRTYGSDWETVADCAALYSQTVQNAGIVTCAKHFPGDGVDFRDQHLHPTYNSLSADEWRQSYGKVYSRLIDEGLMSVMVGHICQPALEMEHTPGLKYEECMPATLSPGLLRGLLRDELGFNGLITTDASIMAGFTMAMPREKAIPTAIASGCDMIVFTTDINEDIDFVTEGLRSGIISPERLDEAVTRVLALKEKACYIGKSPISTETEAWCKACADNSVTLVKNTGNILPVNTEKYLRIRLVVIGNDKTWDGSLMELAAGEFEKRGFKVERYDPFADDLHGVREIPADRLTVTMLNYPPASNKTTVRVEWCPKHAMEVPRFVNEEAAVFVSFANPYHLQDIPRAKVFVNAYTATSATISAVVEKLCGEQAFVGKNPVDPFCGLPDTRF